MFVFPSLKVHHDKLNWSAANRKINTNNQEAIERIQNAPKSTVIEQNEQNNSKRKERIVVNQIYNEKIYWISPKQLNTQNSEFIQAKQRNDALREERAKSRAQVEELLLLN